VIQTKPIFGTPVETAPPALSVTVLDTSIHPTLWALRRAASLARDLGATIRILDVRAVPYPLPLNKPPADREVVARNIRTLADGQSIPTRIEICYGRDILDALLQSLSPSSIVLIGMKRTWWPSKERRWAKELSRHGHHVIFVAGAADLLSSRFLLRRVG
jgi:hypothetical protein